METIKWLRPSGTIIEINAMPEQIKHCESLGWKRVEEKPIPAPEDMPREKEQKDTGKEPKEAGKGKESIYKPKGMGFKKAGK